MTTIYNRQEQKIKRQELRNNATVPERMLWSKLKNKQLGVKFRRQYGIGNYIADFCCPDKKLVIEVDGSVHQMTEQIFYDKEREKSIEELGFKILRFNNTEVEIDRGEVVEKIKKAL